MSSKRNCKCVYRNFPDSTVDKNPAANAGDTGSIPGPGRFHSHRTMKPMSPHAAATEAHVPRAHAPQQKKPSQLEAHTPQLESSPHSPQVEKACRQQ